MTNNNHNGPKAFTRTYKSIHSEENSNTYNTQYKPRVAKNPNLVVRNVYFTKANEKAIVPTKASLGSLGYDLYSIEDITIAPGKTALINTGLKIVVPKGYEMQIRSRSGLALNKSVFVLNSPATIDWDYQGEIKIILHNLGSEDFHIKEGDRIAQAVFAPIIIVRFRPNLNEDNEVSERGEKGFGESGIQGESNYNDDNCEEYDNCEDEIMNQ